MCISFLWTFITPFKISYISEILNIFEEKKNAWYHSCFDTSGGSVEEEIRAFTQK